MKFRNMKISHRLLLGFGLIIFITGIFELFAVSNINKMWQSTENMYLHPLTVSTVSKAVRDIRTNIVAMHRSMKDVALALDVAQVDQAKAKVDDYERQVYKSFDIVFDRFLGDMQDVQNAYDAFVNWKPIRDEVIQLQLAGNRAAAAAITKGKGADHVAFMNKKIQTMIDFANEKGDEFYTGAEVIKNRAVGRSLIFFVSIVVLTIILAFLIARSIVQPLSSMVEVFKRQMSGETSARNRHISSDETGVLAQSFNDLADSIEHQLFIKESIGAASEVFIKSTTLEELANNLVRKLTELTGSQLGALYFLNQDENIFEPLASIGCQADRLTGFDAGALEGEFGRALSTKQIAHITNIPKDTIYLFKTVSGSIMPKEIITIPVIAKQNVVVILSLASLTGYSKRSLELLQLSLQNLNAGFSNILAEEEVRQIARELQDKNSKLESFAKELKNNAEELKEQNIELDQQRRQVEDANRLKGEFLSNMSHELRTPLNSILSLSNVLLQRTGDRLSKEENGYLQIVERNGKQLLMLINDILDLSKIDAGQMEIRPSSVAVSRMVAEIAESIKPIAVDKGLDFKVSLEKDLPHITTDEFLVRRILQNLIGNAAKFTEQGQVLITAESGQEQVLIAVRDTGVGIPAASMDSIFDEFKQVDGTISRRFEGTGLGLAIAKRSALLLGGDILAESEENKGSVFTLILPISIQGAMNEGMNLAQVVTPMDGTVISRPDANAGSISLLIVEDQEPVIIQLSELLEQNGFTCKVARSGTEAIDYCGKSIPDGIILDLMMPEVDGFKVLETIRSKPDTKKVPVLILTAKDLSNSDLKRLSSNNIQQLVRKGAINMDELLEKVRLMLGFEIKSSQKQEVELKDINKKNRVKRKVADADNLTILIVEDNPDNMTSLKAALPPDYIIIEATDGQAGLEMIQGDKPDIVLMDIMLPKLDGVQVLKKVRADKALSEIPVIAITAWAMKGDKEKLLKAGFDEYLAKPFVPGELIEKINTFLDM